MEISCNKHRVALPMWVQTRTRAKQGRMVKQDRFTWLFSDVQ